MKNIIRIAQVVIIALVLAASSSFAADPVGARARIDKNAITIGDRIKLTLDISAPRGAEIQIPGFKDGVMGEFEIKDSSFKKRDHLFGGKSYKYVYYMTTYTVGKKSIPAIEVKYKLRGAKDWVRKKTKSIPVDVRSVLPKVMPTDIKDIKGPAAFFEINWIIVLSGLAILTALISAIIFYIRRRSRKPVKLPHETALEELESLRSRLLNSGDVKEYFVGVSDCIRSYVERVFKFRAPEMTSEEFFNSIQDSAALNIAHRELLRGFMNACDMVKFAKYTPKREEMENIYVTAKNFVNETKETK